MTPGALTIALAGALVILAALGPWLLRRSAPALVRVPRLAVAVIVGGILIWLGTLLAIGPVLAWVGSGPALLPERAAAVCQRCLAAANPFRGDAIDTVLPAALLLALPAVVTLTIAAGLATQLLRRSRRSRAAAYRLLHDARRHQLHGHQVAVVVAARPFALTFPARHGGIVLSTGAVAALDADELTAVLAHEHAHLRQHHHLLAALVASTTMFLRWVPLVSAAADALPHYLEIAADNQARRHASTSALVGALIKLGERAQPVGPDHTGAEILHAAGPERIRQLVRPSGGFTGAMPAVAITAYLVGLAIISATVHLPYATAALTGC